MFLNWNDYPNPTLERFNDTEFQGIRYFTTIDTDLELVRLYFNCLADSLSYIDTVRGSHRLDECSKQILVQNDTAKIRFQERVLGLNTFYPLTAISKDKTGVLRIHKAGFNYYVRK